MRILFRYFFIQAITFCFCFLNNFNGFTQSARNSGNIRFGTLSTQDGLSQSSVFCLAQDKKGFIWIGTKDGLNRYDGYNFITYKYNPQDNSSLSNNEITTLHVDKEGDLWIGTRGGGLNKFLTQSNTFVRYSYKEYGSIIRDIHQSDDTTLWIGSSDGLLKGTGGMDLTKLVNVTKNAVYKDENGNLIAQNKNNISVVAINQLSEDTLIIGTEYGIFFYFPELNQFRRFPISNLNLEIVTSILVSNNKTLWIGSFNGLYKAKPISEGKYDISFYSTAESGVHHITSNRIESLASDLSGNVWVGTRGGGLVKIEKTGNVHAYVNEPTDLSSLSDNIVNSLLVDNTGILWIGTESQGCNNFSIYNKKFNHLKNLPNSKNSLSDDLVTAITGDENIVWIGSAVQGIDKITFNEEGGYSVDHLRNIQVLPGTSTSEVISLLCDREKTLWIGTASNFLINYSEKEEFNRYQVNGYVFALHEDNEGRIWYGTWGQGLGWIDKKTNTLNNRISSSNSLRNLSSDKVISIQSDQQGNLWVGTKGGGLNILPLHMLTSNDINFIGYQYDQKDQNSLSHNDVFCILEDSKKNIWIGTGGGLNKVVWNKKQSLTDAILRREITFRAFLEKDGLPNDVIYGIAEDKMGNLWISTNNGISCYNSDNNRFINYNESDGLQANEFYYNSYYKNTKGDIFFGGVNGLTYFSPDSVKPDYLKSNVVITGLKILNEPVLPGEEINGKIILEKDISLTTNLVITNKQKEITLEFSALYYANPKKVKYFYRLLGFNEEWQKANGNVRSATYTNLDDGDYVFQVKANINDFSTEEEAITELKISVMPPFWRNPWFYFVYISIIVGGLIVFRKYSLIAAKEKNKLLIERLEHKKIIEVTDAKMKFLTNISHEIRTPLTLICDPLDRVLSEGKMDADSQKKLRLISKNVHRLLYLANQLLQLRKIDLGIFKPKLTQIDLVPFIQDILVYFEEYSVRRNIRLTFESDKEEILICIDPNLMSSVFYNLIANSLKFTADGGTVKIKIFIYKGQLQKNLYHLFKIKFSKNNEKQKWVVIQISDTGKGIPEKEIKKIFQRFYQIEEPGKNINTGSGIGLSLVKEYIDIHKGIIEVDSSLNKGSTFTVYLPDENTVKEKSDKQKFLKEDKIIDRSIEEFIDEETVPEVTKSRDENDQRPLILIVEDDHELSDYLNEYLSKIYRVETVHNGEKGLNFAKQFLPDVVISDVMLPGITGLELCSSLKNDIETSHVPIILITARASEENISEGYAHRADFYITKPFNVKVLETQVKMLIESRIHLRNRFSKQVFLKPTDISITPLDERFLKQLLNTTEAHLADSEFDVSKLVDSMNMSHTVILRKVKVLTGLSLVEFIRNHRMKKAAMILQKEKLPIAEVSYMVGFSDPKYFTKCFVKEFGKTPTDYLSEFHD